MADPYAVRPSPSELGFDPEDLRLAIGARWLAGELKAASPIRYVSNDTRELGANDCYIALRGERFDGHDFLKQAFDAGAALALVDERFAKEVGTAPLPCLVVDDCLRGYARIAAYHRQHFRHRQIVAIGGSNGKTTTREMVHTVLAIQGQTLQNPGNNNNQVGVPQTLLCLAQRHRSAVIELGTSEPGEMRALTSMTDPDVAVLTNISEEHLSGLGDMRGVLEEESDMLRCLRSDATAVINFDDHYSLRARQVCRARVVSFGFDPRCDIRASDVLISSKGTWFRLNGRYTFQLQHCGRHFVSNALAAIAVGWTLGIPFEAMQKALASIQPVPGRMRVITPGASLQGITLIDDTYNANPASMRAALKTLNDWDAQAHRIACLGDMLDLGDHAETAHVKLAWYIRNQQLDLLVAVGPRMHAMARHLEGIDLPVWYCDTPEEAGTRLRLEAAPGDVLLFKGSRGMRMERALQALTQAANALT